MFRPLCFVTAILFLANTNLGGPALANQPLAATAEEAAERREQAVAVLRDALFSQPEWIKVHAAEFLLALDYRDDVREVFEQELTEHGDQPQYRIGIWRVLAREALNDRRRNHFISQIRTAFLDVDGVDRIHAAETLAKLDYQAGSVVLDPLDEATALIGAEQRELLKQAELDAFAASANAQDVGLQACARWVLLNSAADQQARRSAAQRLTQLFTDPTERAHSLAAYALSWQPTIESDLWIEIQQAADQEPSESVARVYLIAAEFLHAEAASADPTAAKQKLLQYAASGTCPSQKLHPAIVPADRTNG